MMPNKEETELSTLQNIFNNLLNDNKIIKYSRLNYYKLNNTKSEGWAGERKLINQIFKIAYPELKQNELSMKKYRLSNYVGTFYTLRDRIFTVIE